MYAQRILELRYIVISFFTRIVWYVQAYATIQPDDYEIHIITYAKACA